jgi:hypothetical protein
VKRRRRANLPKTAESQPFAERVGFVVVVLGAGAAGGFLVRQILDYLADARQPVLRHGDVVSALGSVAMLAFFGFVAFNTVRKARR